LVDEVAHSAFWFIIVHHDAGDVSRSMRRRIVRRAQRCPLIPCDCFDFNIAFDRWLLLLGHQGVDVFEPANLDLFNDQTSSGISSANDNLRDFDTVQTDSDWQSNESIISIILEPTESTFLLESKLQLV
jgi:hypothetical protein